MVSSVKEPTNCGHCGQLREGTDQLWELWVFFYIFKIYDQLFENSITVPTRIQSNARHTHPYVQQVHRSLKKIRRSGQSK